MKINMTEHITDRTLISHIILNCMTDTLMKLVKNTRVDGDLMMDVILSINGHELDLEKFMKHWQSQVNHMIKEEAREMQKEKMGDMFMEVEDLLTDLQGRLDEEVDKRLEDWEREE
jgi:hypothetical protein